jgi:4-hydroxyphenylpyruvate dioxygenase
MMPPLFKFRPCIATMSLGSSDIHDLTHKIVSAAREGFRGIELYWDDLVYDCRKEFPRSSKDQLPQREDLTYTAERIKKICDQVGIEVVSLQPFRNFDGSQDDWNDRLNEFENLWLPCAQVLGARIIAVPATINPEGKSSKVQDIVLDVHTLAKKAQEYSINIAYEALCFSAFVDTWQRSLEVAEAAEAEGSGVTNIGIILDTFNIAGKLIPYGCKGGVEEVGRTQSAIYSSPEKLVIQQASLLDLATTLRREKVLLVQVADLDFERELICNHSEVSKDCIKNYSRNHRLFPFESMNKAIQRDLLRAITGGFEDGKKVDEEPSVGYEGWISIEVFNKSTKVMGEETVVTHAKRAWQSWLKMCEEMGWNKGEDGVNGVNGVK